MAIEQEKSTIEVREQISTAGNPHLVLIPLIENLEVCIRAGEIVEIPSDIFAPTKDGEKFYRWVNGGAECEAKVPNAEGEMVMCANRSISLLSFDVPSSAGQEVSIFCSLDHMRALRRDIEEQSEKQGKIPFVGINGWGRS